MKLIGIDIGTTTISGIVMEHNIGNNAELIEAKTIANDSFLPTANDWEKIQDAEQIIKKAKDLLDYFLDQYPEVKRIGLTGQMHGILYVDKAGSCVSPLYTWQDGRGSLPEDNGISLVEEIQKKCQVKTASGYGMVTHIYNLRHHLISDVAVSFCTIMDYFGMYLTGRKRALIHASNAAGFGFFDGYHMCFMKEELGKIGIQEKWLPEVCGAMQELGTYRNRIVTTAIGDNQASFLGAVGNENGTLLVNIGTGGQISVLSDQYFAEDGIEARPFLDGKYLLVGASLCGGKAYALLEEFFRKFVKQVTGQEKSLYGVLENMARKGKEINASRSKSRKLKVTTTFNGTRVNPETGGSITNLFADNFTPEAFTYGVLEGMALELYQMYQIIRTGTYIQVTRMIGSGNGLRKNPVLCEIIEEIFGIKLILAEYEEEAATGAAISSTLLKSIERAK